MAFSGISCGILRELAKAITKLPMIICVTFKMQEEHRGDTILLNCKKIELFGVVNFFVRKMV